MSSLHVRFAGLTLLLLLMWGITSVQMRRRTADLLPTVEIAVEHTTRTGVSVTRTSSGHGPVEISNNGEETVRISLPEEWTRGEVRDALLSSVVADEPSLGFRRWSFPAHASVTFLSNDVWNKLHVRNVSDVPLRLRVVTVDLSANSSETESTLIDAEALLYFR